MDFKEKFSTKQYYSIFFIVAGIFIIYLTFQQDNSLRLWAKIIGLAMIINSLLTFFEETKRKYKITHEDHTGEYTDGEKKIANYFDRKKIKFHFKPKLSLTKSYGFLQIPLKKQEIEPDFYLPEYHVYVEFWGKIDDPEYKKNNYDRKVKLYRDNNISFISIYPKNLANIDWDFTQKLLDLIRTREGIAFKQKTR